MSEMANCGQSDCREECSNVLGRQWLNLLLQGHSFIVRLGHSHILPCIGLSAVRHFGHFCHFSIFIAGVLIGAASLSAQSGQSAERMRPVASLPAEMCGRFREATSFVQTTAGDYLVLDRRDHTVFSVDKARTRVTTVMKAGMEKGNVLQPGMLSLSKDDTFAVSDAPFGQERVQMFFDNGASLGAFLLPGITAPRLTTGPLILNGTGSMHFTGKTLLINAPDSGALVSVLNLEGHVVRQIGTLRATGHEADRALHLALNVGLPLETADGGVIFVFQTGVPMFRKYAADGRLEFERHIEGTVLDGYVQTLPTTWPTRKIGDGTYPMVPPVIRTAALSPAGDLWVSLVAPFTFVYNAAGDKTRTVMFDATGAFSPTSLFFSRASGTLRLLVMPGCYEFSS